MRRMIVIVVSVLVAAGSGFGLIGYVQGADDRASEGVDLVAVLVADADVPVGTLFDTAWVEERIIPSETLRRLMPPTAVTDPGAVQGTTALTAVAKGQVIVASMFGEPAETGLPEGPPTFASQVPEGRVAVSFTATGDQAVGNLIQPGDLVNLLVQVPNASEIGLPDSNGPAIVHVFQALQVVAIGTVVADPTAEEAAANPGTGVYTVAVEPKDSARLLYLTRQYPVFLTLVGPGTDPDEIPPIGAADALPDGLTADDSSAPAGSNP